MPRPIKDGKVVATRINEVKRQELATLLVELGYCYERDGVKLPAWGEFLEAIADGDLMIYKKILPSP